MSKIHPLFDQVMTVVETATSPSARRPFEDWASAGKPVLAEEEPKFVLQPPASEILRVGPDGGWTVFLPHACDKDARIKFLEGQVDEGVKCSDRAQRAFEREKERADLLSKFQSIQPVHQERPVFKSGLMGDWIEAMNTKLAQKEQKIGELEAKLETAQASKSHVGWHPFSTGEEFRCPLYWNAALEEAAKEIEPWAKETWKRCAEENFMPTVNFSDLAARIRSLRK